MKIMQIINHGHSFRFCILSSVLRMNKLQELKQKVLQRYGWSASFHRTSTSSSSVSDNIEENNCYMYSDEKWVCDFCLGLTDRRTYVTSKTYPDTVQGKKDGLNHLAEMILKLLDEEIKKEETKPVTVLHEVFTEPIPVYESNLENWNYFWNHRPTVVGIDTEGNQKSPPVLVQIATDEYTILEVPTNGHLSKDLQKLLLDNSIVKVFCDNTSHLDKKCLGLNVPDNLSVGSPIVDLEFIASEILGPVQVPRGVARLVGLSMPELNVRIEKPKRFKDVYRFSLIEQGKLPKLNSLSDLSYKEQQYAALDAWCTLQVYKRLSEVSTANA